MKQRCEEERPGIIFDQMDATNMTYESSFFDVVVDKATLDAILCKGMDLIGEI